MNAPKLLFAFALAFLLGVAVTVATQRHQKTTAPVAESRAGAPAEANDPGDNDKDDGSSAQDDAPAWPDSAPTPEQVLYAQSKLLQEAIAKLMPRVPDKVNLYFVAFAGDGEENVFRNEAEYADKVLTRRFDAAGHDLLLMNNPATLDEHPLASLSNLETALKAVGEKMDRDADVLLLFLTSHGTKDHLLYVSMDPLPLDQIAPDDLADALAKSGIRNKVVVISACYSGGFIDALKDDSPTVIRLRCELRDHRFRPRVLCRSAEPHRHVRRRIYRSAPSDRRLGKPRRRRALLPSTRHDAADRRETESLAQWRRTRAAGAVHARGATAARRFSDRDSLTA